MTEKQQSALSFISRDGTNESEHMRRAIDEYIEKKMQTHTNASPSLSKPWMTK